MTELKIRQTYGLLNYRGSLPDEPRWWKPGSKREFENEIKRLRALMNWAPACGYMDKKSAKKLVIDTNQRDELARRLAQPIRPPEPLINVEGGHWSTIDTPRHKFKLKAYMPLRLVRKPRMIGYRWDPSAWKRLAHQCQKYQDNPLLAAEPIKAWHHERQWLKDSALFL